MGQWAKRRLRSSSPPAPAAPPPAAVSIVSAEVIGTAQARLHFDGPANSNGAPPDGNFTIDGFAPENVADVFGDPQAIDVINNTDWALAPGSLWDLSAQPNWLFQAAVVPESGTCV